MTTAMGVVNMNNISPHKTVTNLQTITNDSSLNAVDNDRREIIIIRKKVRLNQVEMKMPIIKMEPDSSTSINNNNSVNVNTSRGGRKKPPSAPGSHQPPPLAVARRNARERNRVKQVNNGFANLRSHIPMSIAQAYTQDSSGRNSKKLSKVETLRMAVDYIRSLQRLLSMDDEDREENSERVSLATPSSNSPGSPMMILPDSPLSSDTSSRTSYQPATGYFYEEDTATPGGEDASPVLIEDEEMSNVDPGSPVPSQLSFQYHRIPTSNTLIQLVNSPVEDMKSYQATLQYGASDINSRNLDGGIMSAVHTQPLLQSHAYVTEDGVIYSEAPNEDLVPLSSSPHRLQVSSSLSPAVYSDNSLSPSGKIDTKQSSIEEIQQRIYLPSFSSSLKPSNLHRLSGVTDTVIHQGYSSSLQYSVKKELDDNIYVQENDISGNSDVLTGMMTWWDQDHRLRQPTTSS